MTSLWKFRIIAFVICLGMGAISARNLGIEVLRAPNPSFADSLGAIPAQDQIDRARWIASIAPDRADVQTSAALALAAEALRGPSGYRPDLNQGAQTAARQALAAGPHDSRTWLALARLQSQRALRDPRIAETLRLSYLTGPGLEGLAPARLATVALSEALVDPDLRELARGDVRLILTRRPDLKPTLVAAYRGAPPDGKQFIEESVKNIDPKFLASLPGS